MLIERLKAAREAVGLSQRQLSADLNKSYTFVQKIESLERQLNPVELMDFCEAVGTDFVAFIADFKNEVAVLRLKD